MPGEGDELAHVNLALHPVPKFQPEPVVTDRYHLFK